jgi:hypothetical protein
VGRSTPSQLAFSHDAVEHPGNVRTSDLVQGLAVQRLEALKEADTLLPVPVLWLGVLFDELRNSVAEAANGWGLVIRYKPPELHIPHDHAASFACFREAHSWICADALAHLLAVDTPNHRLALAPCGEYPQAQAGQEFVVVFDASSPGRRDGFDKASGEFLAHANCMR